MILSSEKNLGYALYERFHKDVEEMIPLFEELSKEFKIAHLQDMEELSYMVEEFPDFIKKFGDPDSNSTEVIKESISLIENVSDDNLFNRAEALYYTQKKMSSKLNDSQEKIMKKISDILRKDIKRKNLDDLPMTLTTALRRLIAALIIGTIVVINPIIGIITIIGVIGGYTLKDHITHKIRANMIYELESQVVIVDKKMEDIENGSAPDDLDDSKYDLLKVSQELHHTIEKLKKAQGEM